MPASDLRNDFQAALGPGQRADLERRILGTYLGLAVGDAFGATVEFLTPAEIRAAYGEHRDLIGGGLAAP